MPKTSTKDNAIICQRQMLLFWQIFCEIFLRREHFSPVKIDREGIGNLSSEAKSLIDKQTTPLWRRSEPLLHTIHTDPCQWSPEIHLNKVSGEQSLLMRKKRQLHLELSISQEGHACYLVHPQNNTQINVFWNKHLGIWFDGNSLCSQCSACLPTHSA